MSDKGPERLSENHLPVRYMQTGVQKMKDKRIVGSIRRTLLKYTLDLSSAFPYTQYSFWCLLQHESVP